MVDIAVGLLYIFGFFSLLFLYTTFVRGSSGDKSFFYFHIKASLVVLVFIATYPAIFNCTSICVNESAEPVGLHARIRSIYYGKDFLRQQLSEVDGDLTRKQTQQKYLTESWETIINFIVSMSKVPLDLTSEDSQTKLVISITGLLEKKFPERVRIDLEGMAREIVNNLRDKSLKDAKREALRQLSNIQSEIEKLHKVRSSIKDKLG